VQPLCFSCWNRGPLPAKHLHTHLVPSTHCSRCTLRERTVSRWLHIDSAHCLLRKTIFSFLVHPLQAKLPTWRPGGLSSLLYVLSWLAFPRADPLGRAHGEPSAELSNAYRKCRLYVTTLAMTAMNSHIFSVLHCFEHTKQNFHSQGTVHRS
jgi:hypothetical protein